MEPVDESKLLHLLEQGPTPSPEAGELAGRWVVQHINDEMNDNVKQKLATICFPVDLHNAKSLVNASLKNLCGLNIIQLDVSGQHGLTDEALQTIATIATIQALNLSGLRTITTTGLAYLQALELKSLNVSGCGQITSLAPLQHLTSLHELSLSGCSKIRDADLAVLKTLPIESLDLSNCFGISTTGLAHLSGHSHLKTLDISKNPYWNKGKIAEFEAANPTITIKK